MKPGPAIFWLVMSFALLLWFGALLDPECCSFRGAYPPEPYTDPLPSEESTPYGY